MFSVTIDSFQMEMDRISIRNFDLSAKMVLDCSKLEDIDHETEKRRFQMYFAIRGLY